MSRIAVPSVRSLLIQLVVGEQVLATGTGFVVDSRSGPTLITNRHNVTGRHQDNSAPLSPTGGVPDSLNIVHNRKGKLGEWVARKESLYSRGKPRWHEHPTLKSKADVVALPLKQFADVELYKYDVHNLGPAISRGPAETVSVVGFPFGMQGGGSLAIWATGFIASEPAIDLNDLPIFLIDCRSRPGQSGSAVIAYGVGGAFAMEDGSTAIMGGEVIRLLGVYSGRINEQSDFGIVWKASVLVELINSI